MKNRISIYLKAKLDQADGMAIEPILSNAEGLEIITALEATRPEVASIELLLRRATVYVDAKHMHIVTTMPEGPPVKSPCAACDLLAEIREALVSPQLLSADKT